VSMFDDLVGELVESSCRLKIAVGNGIVDFGWCYGVMFGGKVNWRWL
jgi:hypothetical protein